MAKAKAQKRTVYAPVVAEARDDVARKKNPADLTGRNLKAIKARLDRLEVYVLNLQRAVGVR